MYFSTVDRSCDKLFLFLTVLLKTIFLKMGFIVFRWRRGIKRRDNSLHIDWYKQGSLSLLKSYDFERLWWVKIAIFVAWSKSCQRIDITAWIKLTQCSYCILWKRINRFLFTICVKPNVMIDWDYFIIRTIFIGTILYE